ncbi:response regulator transcription factor [Salipiger mucosus]|uniref:response regulator transcription factor n=1 Tax=Salipiger mucosus TaxID=263378 RepID=UPI0005638811|nr:LuxR C-terminal-related transcriptional regulator [Salipiger mucosus]
MPADGTDGPSDRERDVLLAFARGDPAKIIARALSISPKTVETHKYRGLSKLGLSGRSSLLSHALDHGWQL